MNRYTSYVIWSRRFFVCVWKLNDHFKVDCRLTACSLYLVWETFYTGLPDGFPVLLHVQQHSIPSGEKAVQAAKLTEREASEDKDPGSPPERVTPEWQVTEDGEKRWVITHHYHQKTVPRLSHLGRYWPTTQNTSSAIYIYSFFSREWLACRMWSTVALKWVSVVLSYKLSAFTWKTPIPCGACTSTFYENCHGSKCSSNYYYLFSITFNYILIFIF